MLNQYYDDWGLISATTNGKGEIGENNLLYSIEHFFLTGNDKIEIWHAIQNCQITKGIFVQHPSHQLTGEDRYMSRDQLIAIFAFCVATGFNYHKMIWKEIKRQWFRYDNVNPPETWLEKLKSLAFIQSGDLIYYGICAGGIWWKLLYPFLIIKQLVTILTTYKVRPELYWRLWYKYKGIPYTYRKMIATDGKLLTFVQTQNMSFLFKIYTKIIKKRFGGWNGVFKIFFPDPVHPNVIDSTNI